MLKGMYSKSYKFVWRYGHDDRKQKKKQNIIKIIIIR